MDGFAHGLIATEAERHIGDTARNFGTRQVVLDPAHRLDEINGVVVVLFNAGGNGKDIRVKNDVFGREADFIDQHTISAFANLFFARAGVGLAFFVKSHDHGRRAVAFHQFGLLFERLDALFHADGVDDGLALHAAQTRFDDFPFGRIDHHRHFGDVGFARHQIQKTHHGGLAVEHGLVHIHIHHLRTVFHLLTRHGQGVFVLAVQNHACKGFGTCDIGALADIDKQGAVVDLKRLQPAQTQGRGG